ncbi:MAG: Do family serine endopeptidase [Paracoccaceae bacterium]|nr:Do family serine endopeptidase [Paracoccaceae bacterium]
MRAIWGLALGLALVLGQSTGAVAKGAPDGFADLAAKVSPAVVDITTSTTVAAPTDGGAQVPPGSPFEQFFRDFMNQQGQGDGNGGAAPPPAGPQRSEALGSGFVISADGYIVTNNHVIDGADDIEIQFIDGTSEKAKVVGIDKATDIALLKVAAAKPLPFVTLGNSDAMRVGDWVMAMGNPLGQGFSVTAGIVSAKGRTLNGSYDDFFQTDASINKGNSGGPLFNMDGQVIGVNTAILSPNGGSIGIGFSMASNVVTKVVDQLKKYGETRRGWLGVRIQDVTQDMADAMGLPKAGGAMVTDVPTGPAATAGLKAGDVITSFDGTNVPDTRELVRKVASTEIGKAVQVGVIRDGKPITLTVTLGRRETADAATTPAVKTPAPAPQVDESMLGMKLGALTAEDRTKLKLPVTAEGIIVRSVDPASEAETKGLQAGDLIVEAGQQKVATLKDLQERITQAKDAGRKSVLLLIRRAGDPRFVALSVN